MPPNKNALTRYRALDNCFRNTGRRYNIDDLVEACNSAISLDGEKDVSVQRTMVYRDIKYMESVEGYNVELERHKEGRVVYLSYADSAFSIFSQPLNELEANQLREALLTLGRFKGLPQYNWINELSTRLEADFNLRSESGVIISFDENENLKGLEYIPEIYNAILYKKVLSIDYKSFKSDVSTNIIFNPFYLKQFNTRWFLFGKSNNFKAITNLALDRIEFIKNTDKKYIDSDINFNEYFDDIVGVTKLDANIEHLVLEIADKSLLPYLETKIIHVSQNIVEVDAKFYIHLDIIPNSELESLILSFGEKVVVLEPQSLVEKLKERIVKLKNNYLCT